MNKKAVHQITDTLGTDAICAAFGVTPHSVRGARTSGRFPAGWFHPMELMCIEAGIPCPRNAFNWTSRAKKTSASIASVNQDCACQDARAS